MKLWREQVADEVYSLLIDKAWEKPLDAWELRNLAEEIAKHIPTPVTREGHPQARVRD